MWIDVKDSDSISILQYIPRAPVPWMAGCITIHLYYSDKLYRSDSLVFFLSPVDINLVNLSGQMRRAMLLLNHLLPKRLGFHTSLSFRELPVLLSP